MTMILASNFLVDNAVTLAMAFAGLGLVVAFVLIRMVTR
ncbi:MAG: hypothetical protein ACI9UA_001649, partial [Pseudoalteromonas tetraodonis]